MRLVKQGQSLVAEQRGLDPESSCSIDSVLKRIRWIDWTAPSLRCCPVGRQADGSVRSDVMGDQAFWVSSSRIFTITPGREHQEISSYQACRHNDGDQLLQLFDVHPRILTLLCGEFRSRSRTMKLAEQR